MEMWLSILFFFFKNTQSTPLHNCVYIGISVTGGIRACFVTVVSIIIVAPFGLRTGGSSFRSARALAGDLIFFFFWCNTV